MSKCLIRGLKNQPVMSDALPESVLLFIQAWDQHYGYRSFMNPPLAKSKKEALLFSWLKAFSVLHILSSGSCDIIWLIQLTKMLCNISSQSYLRLM